MCGMCDMCVCIFVMVLDVMACTLHSNTHGHTHSSTFQMSVIQITKVLSLWVMVRYSYGLLLKPSNMITMT